MWIERNANAPGEIYTSMSESESSASWLDAVLSLVDDNTDGECRSGLAIGDLWSSLVVVVVVLAQASGWCWRAPVTASGVASGTGDADRRSVFGCCNGGCWPAR